MIEIRTVRVIDMAKLVNGFERMNKSNGELRDIIKQGGMSIRGKVYREPMEKIAIIMDDDWYWKI